MVISLTQNIDCPKSKYLVFTSAGDNSNLHLWLKGHRNFDLWVTYYGNESNRHKDHADYYIAKKGGKFPNLHYVYQHWKDILSHYQAIIVMDDDIIINGSEISRLFEIREQYNLWILQPAFSPGGKISLPITLVRPLNSLRYTNFVEVTCPLFRKDKLDEFMKIFDPVLVGWGIEWWFLDLLAPDVQNKVAIIDEIICINPHDCIKGGQIREIDLLQDTPTRIKNWEKAKKKYKFKVQQPRKFGAIKRKISFPTVIYNIRVLTMYLNYKFTKRVIKSLLKCGTRTQSTFTAS